MNIITFLLWKSHAITRREDFTPRTEIKCKDCGWVGRSDDLRADSCSDDMWSSWICPSCKSWYSPSDYYIRRLF